MKGKINLKTIIVVLILVLVGVLGVLGMNTAKTFLGSAAGQVEPVAVVARPGTDGKSTTISWTSDKESMGIVEYGTTPASLLLRAVETAQTTNHSVVLSPLKAGVTYYYRIRVGDEVFDNSGIPYSFKIEAEMMAEVSPTAGSGPKVTPILVDGNQDSCVIDYDLNGRVSTAERLCCANRQEIGSQGCKTNLDYNCDGKVDADDNTCCQIRLGAKSGECQQGVDYNCDGKVRVGDLAECTKIKQGGL